MNSKVRSNIAVGEAISYFSRNGFLIFTPLGDQGGHIDLVVSRDGVTLHKVQCKYTEKTQRIPTLFYVDLRMYSGRNITTMQCVYDEHSFDFLFVVTPSGKYLINWVEYVGIRGKVPTAICLGEKSLAIKCLNAS